MGCGVGFPPGSCFNLPSKQLRKDGMLRRVSSLEEVEGWHWERLSQGRDGVTITSPGRISELCGCDTWGRGSVLALAVLGEPLGLLI